MRKNPRDKASGLPKGYVKGLSSSTAKARKAHWEKMSKLSDRDPRAYEPAPGDATAKTVPSKATREVRKIMNREEVEIPDSTSRQLKKFVKQLDKSVKTHAKQRDVLKNLVKKDDISEEAENSLSAKSKKFGVPLGTLKTVYRRGVAAWNSGHRPGTTPQQWGHARVNSYLRKGKGTYHGADKDLREFVNDGEMHEEWEVKRGTKVLSTHKKKDDADVKAMKHPLNKVVAKEEIAVNAAGAGNVAGLGVGPQGEPGVHMKKKKKTVLASFKRFIGK